MPLTCSVGLTKKVGQPDYGSLGASCSVQFEVDSTLLQTDLESFQRQVRNAYVACTQAVNGELARQQKARTPGATVPSSQPTPSNGNGSQHRASDKQIEYINQLARQIGGLGVRRLDTLAGKMFDKPLVDVSSLEASSLIDTLKAIKAGDVDLDAALKGAST